MAPPALPLLREKLQVLMLAVLPSSTVSPPPPAKVAEFRTKLRKEINTHGIRGTESETRSQGLLPLAIPYAVGRAGKM